MNIVHIRLGYKTEGSESGFELMPTGGYTLCYNCVEIEGRVHVQYAYSQCSMDDNFVKAEGMRYAALRLNAGMQYASIRLANAKSSKTFDTFALCDVQEVEGKKYAHGEDANGNALIDVDSSAFDVRGTLIKHFCWKTFGADFEEVGMRRKNLFVLLQEPESNIPEEVEQILDDLELIMDTQAIRGSELYQRLNSVYIAILDLYV